MEIVCPHCGAVNRVPAERLRDQPKCGKCGQQVLSAQPVELTAATFDRFIGRNELPVLVDFWGDRKGRSSAFRRKVRPRSGMQAPRSRPRHPLRCPIPLRGPLGRRSGASWCGPCKQFAPVFSQLAGPWASRVRFAKVDTEAEQALAARHGIRGIPTLAVFKGGREVDRVSGALPAQQLEAWLRRF